MSEKKESEKGSLKSQIWIYGCIAVIVYLLIFYFLQPFDESTATLLRGVNLICLAAVSSLIFILVAHQFNWFNTKTGQIIMLITIGFILWTIAEIIFLGYDAREIFLGIEAPDISEADIFYIAGYVPFAIALFWNIRTIKMKFKHVIMLLWIALSILIFVLIIWIVISFFLVAGEITFINIVLAIYPFEDFIIISLVLVLVLKFRSGEIGKPWGLIIIGFILEAIGDIWFFYEDGVLGTYGPYSLADLCFALGYLAYIAGAFYFRWLYKH